MVRGLYTVMHVDDGDECIPGTDVYVLVSSCHSTDYDEWVERVVECDVCEHFLALCQGGPIAMEAAKWHAKMVHALQPVTG